MVVTASIVLHALRRVSGSVTTSVVIQAKSPEKNNFLEFTFGAICKMALL